MKVQLTTMLFQKARKELFHFQAYIVSFHLNPYITSRTHPTDHCFYFFFSSLFYYLESPVVLLPPSPPLPLFRGGHRVAPYRSQSL